MYLRASLIQLSDQDKDIKVIEKNNAYRMAVFLCV